MPPVLRRLHALLVWLAVAVFTALFVARALEPGTAVWLADHAATGVLMVLQGALALMGLLLLVWPPTLPWLRGVWRNLKRRSGVDRGPMLRALKELEHLETAEKHLTIGRTLWQMGDGRKALPHLARAAELDPEQLASRYLLGQVLRAGGASAEAAAVLSQVVALDPEHGFGDARRELARALVECGQGNQALAQLQANDQQHGASAFSCFWRGRAHQQLGDPAAAREAFRAARDHRPAAGTPPEPNADYWRALARVAPLMAPPKARQPIRAKGET